MAKIVVGGKLNLDGNPLSIKENEHIHALNIVNNSDGNDINMMSNEESNALFATVTLGMIFIGKVHISNNETLIFSVADDETSAQIGILNDETGYTVIVDDVNNILNFRIAHQIDAIYRLRKGCERTVYFTDNFNKPRYYNIDKPGDFLTAGNVDPFKFDLFLTVEELPVITSVEIVLGGELPSGSYNAAITLLDADFNPTPFMSVFEPVIIYADGTNNNFSNINGSTGKDNLYRSNLKTNKAIQITLDPTTLNIDKYPYYKIAMICANNGSGIINKVLVSNIQSTTLNTFVFGSIGSSLTEIPIEEIQYNGLNISKVKNIEQIENRLILTNVKNTQNNLCNLQKYASKIATDCILKTISLDDINADGNQKRGTANLEGIGYMPGEIYSFGIVYVFKDNTFSPVYHIPGKNGNISDNTTVYAPDTNVIPMRIENTGTVTYTNTTSCSGNIMGLDNVDEPITDATLVRHHRFPLRSQIGADGIPLVEEDITFEDVILHRLVLVFTDPGGFSMTNGERIILDVTISINGAIEHILLKDVYLDNDIGPRKTLIITNYTSYIPIKLVSVQIASPISAAYTTLATVINANTQILVPDTMFPLANEITYTAMEIDLLTGAVGRYSVWTTQGLPSDVDYYDAANPDSGYYTQTYRERVQLYYFNLKPSFELKKSKKSTSKNATTQILGVKFSNITIPTTAEIGQEIIGYYIVRNERTESEKTILDSGILTPIVKRTNAVSGSYFSAFSHLSPNIRTGGGGTPLGTSIDKDFWGLINPEFKFKQKEYTGYELLIEGCYIPVQGDETTLHLDAASSKTYGSTMTVDVQSGTSFNPEVNAGGDLDGYQLNILSRQYKVKYATIKTMSLAHSFFTTSIILASDIAQYFYLRPAMARVITLASTLREIWNTTADNANGFIALNTPSILDTDLYQIYKPYVVLRKPQAGVISHYANYKYLQYHFEHKSMIPITTDTTVIFNGDSYISPMNYTQCLPYNFTTPIRKSKGTNWLSIIEATIAVIGAVVLSVVTLGGAAPAVAAGAATAASAVTTTTVVSAAAAAGAIGAITSAVGAVVLAIVHQVKADAIYEMYMKKYKEGLGDAIKDNETEASDLLGGVHAFGTEVYDDQVRWFFDHVTTLWFESAININWRLKTDVGIDFLPGPGDLNREQIEQYALKKLTSIDQKNKGGRLYNGFAFPELYDINLDFERRNKEKPQYALTDDYECCSDCLETFPHRIHYSEQSFQEERKDNYKTFLPNNYKDIEGETGEIIDTFRLNNELFIHTESALWKMPKNYQERVTGEITTFIGTGSFFEIPPQKMIDDDTGMSVGIQHKWSSIKTIDSYFFINEKERKIYQFTGTNIKAISDQNFQWFWEHLPLTQDRSFFNDNNRNFNYRDNPSNPFGTGYISVYDPEKRRLIFTKKDYIFNAVDDDNVPFEDYELCYNDNTLTIFPDYHNTIATNIALGYVYTGIVNCQMIFEHPTLGQLAVSGVERTGAFADKLNTSFTISYSLPTEANPNGTWLSFHSYRPYFYINSANNFFSSKPNTKAITLPGDPPADWDVNGFWKHNIKNTYQRFYDETHPMILEFTMTSEDLENKIWDYIAFLTEAKIYDSENKEYINVKDITFDEIIIYNSRQSTGSLQITHKNYINNWVAKDPSYIRNQIVNTSSTILAEKDEKEWTINQIRDYVVDKTVSLFIKNETIHMSSKYNDKIVNSAATDILKNWMQQEKLRDKYVTIRFIFNNFEKSETHTENSIKLIFNYLRNMAITSHR